MPIHHYVHSTDRVVITTCFGDISFDHVLESLQALGVDPRFKPRVPAVGRFVASLKTEASAQAPGDSAFLVPVFQHRQAS
jgi:hypothetical protein